MKKVLVLFNGRGDKSAQLTTTLAEQLTDCEVVEAALSEVSILAEPGEVRMWIDRLDQQLSDFDFVWFRNWQRHPEIARAVAVVLDSHKIPYCDTEVGQLQSFSKITEQVVLANHNLPNIPTYFGPAGTFPQYVAEHQFFRYPLVVKNPFGRKSQGTYIAESEEQLHELAQKHTIDYMMLEPRIDSDGSDYRVMVTGDTVGYVSARKIVEHHDTTDRIAVKNSGMIDPADFDPEIIAVSKRAARALNREVAGVDIIIDSNGAHWIIEVNNAPSILGGAKGRASKKVDAIAEYIQTSLS